MSGVFFLSNANYELLASSDAKVLALKLIPKSQLYCQMP